MKNLRKQLYLSIVMTHLETNYQVAITFIHALRNG